MNPEGDIYQHQFPEPANSAGNVFSPALLLIFVICVIAMGLLLPLSWHGTGGHHVNQNKATLAKIKSALGDFEVEFDRFPTTAEGLSALVTNPDTLPNWNHPFLDTLPLDQWGHPFNYRSPGTAGALYDLFSSGPDGIPETPDDVKVDQ